MLRLVSRSTEHRDTSRFLGGCVLPWGDHITAQMVFAEMNRRQIESCNGGDTNLPEVVISAVGYMSKILLSSRSVQTGLVLLRHFPEYYIEIGG